MATAVLNILFLVQAATAALPQLQLARSSSARSAVVLPRYLQRRDDFVGINTTSIPDAQASYYTNISFGTPPQFQQLLVATAASDTYVNTYELCDNGVVGNPCRGNVFNRAESTSYELVDGAPTWNVSFSDGSTVDGIFGRDTILFGDMSIGQVEFGLVTSASTTAGFTSGQLGLGYSANEAVAPGYLYPNFIEVLSYSGVINSRLFSLYLDGFSDSGGILFGGIDSSKYSGQLVTLNLEPDPSWSQSVVRNYYTHLTSLSVVSDSLNIQQTIFSSDDQQNTSALGIELCVGCSAFQIPPEHYTQLLDTAFPFVDRENSSCSCEHRNVDITIQATLGGTSTTSVPATDFFVPIFTQDDDSKEKPLTYANGTQVCYFMITPTSSQSDHAILSDSILRSMYVVFDLDNGQISVAQAATDDAAEPDIRAVAAGPNGVANAASRVQGASANTYSIATAAHIDADFSTSKLSITSKPTTTASAPLSRSASPTLGSEASSTISAASVPTSSSGALPTTMQAGGWTRTLLTLMALLGPIIMSTWT